jgi:hypothetical protein
MNEPQTVEQAANALAAMHRQNDPETTAIYRIDRPDEVRLLEVTGSVGAVGDLLPFRFAARPEMGVPYPSVVVLASQHEFDLLQRGQLSLPKDFGHPDELLKVG